MTTDDLDAQILAAHARGLGRNAIALELGASRRRVSAVIADAGLTFARSPHTAAARRRRSADTAERRAAVAARVLDRAERALDDLDGLHDPVDALDVERRARVVQSVAQAVGALTRARPLDSGDADTEAVRVVFGAFLDSARQQFAEPTPADPGLTPKGQNA